MTHARWILVVGCLAWCSALALPAAGAAPKKKGAPGIAIKLLSNSRMLTTADQRAYRLVLPKAPLKFSVANAKGERLMCKLRPNRKADAKGTLPSIGLAGAAGARAHQPGQTER